MIDRVQFVQAFIPRSKTNTPDRLEVREMIRPFLRARWEQMGKPEAGPVFPCERPSHRTGSKAGDFRKVRGSSFAERLRRNLFLAGVVRAKPTLVAYVKPGTRTDLGKQSLQATKPAPNPRDPLYYETATTMPVDFHSFRRAYSTALAEAGVSVQQAMLLAHHSDAKVHMRYVQQTEAMRRIPIAALPALLGTIGANGANQNDAAKNKAHQTANWPGPKVRKQAQKKAKTPHGASFVNRRSGVQVPRVALEIIEESGGLGATCTRFCTRSAPSLPTTASHEPVFRGSVWTPTVWVGVLLNVWTTSTQ